MYAGFWKRFFALIIDNAILNAILTVILNIVMIGVDADKINSFKDALPYISIWGALIILAFLYNPLFESSPMQATPGKYVLGIKVVDMNGGRVSFWRALGRNLGKIITSFTLNIGYVMAGFTVRKQALHDKMASCLVINKKAEGQPLTELPPATGGQIFLAILGGFTPIIISLIIIISFFAVIFKLLLSAGALPSFTNSAFSTSESSITDSKSASKDLGGLDSFLASDDPDLDVFEAEMTGVALGLISSYQKFYAQDNGGRYATSLEELKGGLIQLPEESIKDYKDKISFGQNYVFAAIEAKGKAPAYTITSCYENRKTCISTGDSAFAKETGFDLAAPENCCL